MGVVNSEEAGLGWVSLPFSGPESMAAASGEVGGYIRAIEPQLSPIQVTRYLTHPSSPLAKCIKRLKCCCGNLGGRCLRWQRVSGSHRPLGQGRVGHRGQPGGRAAGEVPAGPARRRRRMGLGAHAPGVECRPLECVRLKWEGSLFKLVKRAQSSSPLNVSGCSLSG